MELKNRESTRHKIPSFFLCFRFWFTPDRDDYAVLRRIISDRSFRFFHYCELFIAASRINYLFCARNFALKTNGGKNPRVHLSIPTIYFNSWATRDKFTGWNSRVNLKKIHLLQPCNSHNRLHVSTEMHSVSRNSEKYVIIINNIAWCN